MENCPPPRGSAQICPFPMEVPQGGGISGGIQQPIFHIIGETSFCGLQSHLLKTSAAPDPIRFPGVPLALEEGRPATRLAQRSTQKRKGVTDAFCAWRPLQAGGMAPPPEEREVTGTRDANWNPSQGEGKASGAFIARRLPSSATAHPRRRGMAGLPHTIQQRRYLAAQKQEDSYQGSRCGIEDAFSKREGQASQGTDFSGMHIQGGSRT